MALVVTPHIFAPNTPAYSGQVNANQSAITAQVNGNLDEANLKSGGVTPSRIATLPRARAAINPWTQGGQGGGYMLLGGASYDTDNMYDDVADYFTIVTAGVYQVSVSTTTDVAAPQFLCIRQGPGGVLPGVPTSSSLMVASDDHQGSGAVFSSCSGAAYFSAGDRVAPYWVNQATGLVTVTIGQFNAVWLSP